MYSNAKVGAKDVKLTKEQEDRLKSLKAALPDKSVAYSSKHCGEFILNNQWTVNSIVAYIKDQNATWKRLYGRKGRDADYDKELLEKQWLLSSVDCKVRHGFLTKDEGVQARTAIMRK